MCVYLIFRYALSLGSTIEFLATKEKIETCYELKKLIDQAIKLNVDDAMLRYTRGRWFYGELKRVRASLASGYAVIWGKIVLF